MGVEAERTYDAVTRELLVDEDFDVDFTPDGLLVPASWAAGAWMALLWAVIGSAAMFAVYFLLALISPSSMGMGDVKLSLVIGLLLGWFGLTAWLIALLAAFVVGGLVAIVALVLRRVTLRGSIPFGPSMLAGAFIALLVVGS